MRNRISKSSLKFWRIGGVLALLCVATVASADDDVIGSVQGVQEYARNSTPPADVSLQARLLFSTPRWNRFRIQQSGLSVWCQADPDARKVIRDARLGDLLLLKGKSGDTSVFINVQQAKILSRGSRKDITYWPQIEDEPLRVNRCVQLQGTVGETLVRAEETQLILNEFDQTVTARIFSESIGEQQDSYNGRAVRITGYLELHPARSTPTHRCAQFLLMKREQVQFINPEDRVRPHSVKMTAHVDAIVDDDVFAGGRRVATHFAHSLELGKVYTFDLTDIDAHEKTGRSVAIYESNSFASQITPLKSAESIDVPQMRYQRVTTTGKITNIESSDSKIWLRMKSNNVPFVAVVSFDPTKDSLEAYKPGATYRLSGAIDELPDTSVGEKFLIRVGNTRDVQSETLHFFTVQQIRWIATCGVLFLGLLASWQLSLRQQVKRKTRELRSLNAQILAAVGAVQDGILVFDLNRRVCLTDKKLFNLLGGNEVRLGTHADEVLNQHLLPQLDCEAFQSLWTDVQDKPLVTKEGEFETKQHRGWMNVVTSPVMDEQDQVLGRIWTFRDTTAQRKLQEETLQSQKLNAIGRLTGGIAHDFNNLLHVISSNLELIEIDSVNSLIKENVAVAKLATDRAAGLTSQLLTFARKSDSQTSCINVHQTIEQVFELLQKTVGANITLTLDVDDALWGAEADDSQLEQVLINLCLNARDAIGERLGEIRISASNLSDSAIGDAVRIVVQDDGMGMSAETIGNVFDPFFTTKEVGKGTGLGLTLVHGAITKIGGTVSIESELDEGTAVEILIKRSSGTSPLPIRQDTCVTITHDDSPLEILLVDDDELVRQAGKRIIEAVGQRVRCVAGGREAIEVLKANHPVDLVILDLTMPVMTGRETLIELRKLRPEIAIVICSGYSSETHRFQNEPPIYRPNAFLNKPFHLKDFNELLNQFKHKQL